MTSTSDDTATQLLRLATAVGRLRPDWRSAEAFYEARSEIIGDLRTLARSPPLVRTVVRIVTVPTPPAPSCPIAVASLPRPRRLRRWRRLPLPPRSVAGQAMLSLHGRPQAGPPKRA